MQKNKPPKFLGLSCLALLYDMDEVMCEDKWNTLPLDAKLGLEVTQDMAKVYMKKLDKKVDHSAGSKKENEKAGIGRNSVSYLPVTADHDVVTVAVSDPQNVSGHTVACAGQSELLDGAFKSITVNTLKLL